MYLHEIIAEHKRGQARGIASICSAHPAVIRETLKTFEHPLIEVTCNQVNQFGGYTGMTPQSFAGALRRIAVEAGCPPENILLGGDHLGPHVWRGQGADHAMQNAKTMIADFARAGFVKLHLDCSMRLADDPGGPLDQDVSARRAAELAQVAEGQGSPELYYVIGSEVPPPGGAAAREGRLTITGAESVGQTMELHRQAFHRLRLDAAWERVIAVVVQPGVEFGDDFVVPYRAAAARPLSQFIESGPLVYEAHSTDYQPCAALTELVRDHFAILKVGPALTFAYREAVFALAMIESECILKARRSNLLQVMEEVMRGQPEHWREYYNGTPRQQLFKRKFSLSDRIRYYWSNPRVRRALARLMQNLGEEALPYSLSSQYFGETGFSAQQAISWKIQTVLGRYMAACEGRCP